MQGTYINVYFYEYTDEEFLDYNYFSTYRKYKMENSNNLNYERQTEIAVKHCLEHTLKRPIDVLNFDMNEYGKPIILIDDTYMNITHSNNKLIIAISNNEIGIDLQQVHEKYIKVQKKIFKTLENKEIDIVVKTFTIKEAYIKFYGKTVLFDLTRITVEDDNILGYFGNLKYRSFIINDYYFTIAAKKVENINSYSIKDLNHLKTIEKSYIINKSNEEEE